MRKTFSRSWVLAALIAASILAGISHAFFDDEPKLIDAHIHYSRDAWGQIPPAKAIDLLREAGLSKAFVSSSGDEGTQMLYLLAPELIVPVLRPYREVGDQDTWMHDDTVPPMLEELLEKNDYGGFGEFHVFGEDVDLPVVQKSILLARKYNLFLHAHADVAAIDKIFAIDPDATVLWAHAGFEPPEIVAQALQRHPNLWADLAFVFVANEGGEVNHSWRKVLERYSNRFMVGTDTYVPERWHYVSEHARVSRTWIESLPQEVAQNIAYRNAENLLLHARK